MDATSQSNVVLTVAGLPIRVLQGSKVFFFKTGMAIDADGAPTAYHPAGKGLDYLANAGHHGNWYGVVTDNGRKDGKPVVQGANDPAPGFYISPTALRYHHLPRADPRSYVDSTTVPYISLPKHTHEKLRSYLGDLAYVVNATNGKSSAAIYADVGPAHKIGEGSIALANALGINSNPRHGGANANVVYVVFPHSGTGAPMRASQVDAAAKKLFHDWGGFSRLAACFPELSARLKG
jgi:hypothetical protein